MSDMVKESPHLFSDLPPPMAEQALDNNLRGYLNTHTDIVTQIDKPVSIDFIGALSAQVDDPILFNNIIEYPDFRLTDILVKNRVNQARAMGVSREHYLQTLAYRLRQPPRPFKQVSKSDAPVKEIVWLGDDVDLNKLPIPKHKEVDKHPYITAMNIVKDPETGFYNSSHAGTYVIGKNKD